MKLNEIKAIDKHEFNIAGMDVLGMYLDKLPAFKDIIKKIAIDAKMTATEFREFKEMTLVEDTLQGTSSNSMIRTHFDYPKMSMMMEVELCRDDDAFNTMMWRTFTEHPAYIKINNNYYRLLHTGQTAAGEYSYRTIDKYSALNAVSFSGETLRELRSLLLTQTNRSSADDIYASFKGQKITGMLVFSP